MNVIRCVIAALALASATMASGHNFWLQPESHKVETGDSLQVDFKIGDVGQDADDWGVYWERVAAIRLYGPNGVTDQQDALRVSSGAERGRAVIAAAMPGSYVLGFESNTAFSDLEAVRFNRYVANEGLSAIAAHRAALRLEGANGTELYARRAKALIQVGERRTNNVTQRIGQILEIVPLNNPFALSEEEQLTLQVIWRGEPLEGAKLHASPINGSAPPIVVSTSADGVATVSGPGASAMLYTVVWGVPAPHDARADYLTFFSSLTVANP